MSTTALNEFFRIGRGGRPALSRLLALALALLLGLSLAPAARADWSDDANQIRNLVRAGEYVAAEKAADDSLKRGPGGFLFSGTGTLTIHYWRGRLRLLLGNADGAIEDADALIKGASFLVPADMGYTLRAVARAVKGDAAGAQADFDAALKTAAGGMLSRFRTLGVIGERAVAKLLLGDAPGAEADFAQAVAGEQSGLGLDEYIRARREAWTQLRAAAAKIVAGDAQAARELAQSAIAAFKNSRAASNAEFVSAQLVLNELARRDGAVAVLPAAAPAQPVDPGILALLTQGPKQSATWGVSGADAEGGGMLIKAVSEGMPAAAAGLKAGDVLLSVEGKAVRNEADWDATRETWPLFTPLRLVVRRDGAEQEKRISLQGRMRFNVVPLDLGFTAPGVPPAPDMSKLSAVDALDAFNVLERVVIDPKSGRVEVIGRYDPRYATGPIPYLDLLKTALAYPTPRLNIDPTPPTAKLLADLKTVFVDRLNNFPFNRMVDVVQGHPALERDRQLMIREIARLYGVAPEEYAAWFNFARIDVLRDGANNPFPPPALRDVKVRVYRNLGYPEIATALGHVYRQTPEGAAEALRSLGRGDEAAAILSRGGDEVHGALLVAAYMAMADVSGSLVKQTRDDIRKYYAEKRMKWQIAVQAAESVMPYASRDGKVDVMHQAFGRIVLSNPAGQLFFPEAADARSMPVPIDLERRSQLASIMFEADYALKTISTKPEVFSRVPGFMTSYEYAVKNLLAGSRDAKSDRMWIEPLKMDMGVSPSRNVIDFATARMIVRSADAADLIDLQSAKAGKDDPYQIWVTGLMSSHYDLFAQAVPAFHKVREAAKVIALAQWLLAGKANVNLDDVRQEPWDMPEAFPLINTIAQVQVVLPDGKFQNRTSLVTSGGVSFKPRATWTTTAPSVQAETRAIDHLALSAGLGQRAVQAAQGGNLEEARHLAELSAQAMNGSLSRADLAKLNVPVPEATAAAAPASVQLQKALLRSTVKQIDALKQDPSRGSAALAELANVYSGVQSNPVAASDYLLKLQTGALAAPAVVPAPARPATPVPAPVVQPVPPVPAPTVVDTGGPIQPRPQSACSVVLAQGETIPGDKKAYLANRLAEARNRLRYINEALRKLAALNQTQRAEIEKMTNDISKDYEAATERAYDFAVSTLTELPLAKYADIHTTRIKFLENSIRNQNLARTAPMSDAMRKAMELDIMQMTALKDRYVEAFSSTEKMLALYAGANYGKDIYKWNEETRDTGDWKRGWEATRLGGKILLDHPWLEKYLDQKDWFGGDKLWQVVAMGKMAWTASDFFWDIMNQYGAWQPLANSLLKDLQFNAQAMDQLRVKAQNTSQEIDCIEKLVQR